MPTLKFPHIIRKISASLQFPLLEHFFFIFTLILILLNIFQPFLFPSSEEKRLRLKLMQNPNSRSLHEKLGRYYLPINLSAAQREYQLAQESYSENTTKDDGVLGTQSSPLETWRNIKKQELKLTEEASYWQRMLTQFPDYQYTLLKLAAIYTQLGEKERAKEFLEELLEKSPLDETASNLIQKLK